MSDVSASGEVVWADVHALLQTVRCFRSRSEQCPANAVAQKNSTLFILEGFSVCGHCLCAFWLGATMTRRRLQERSASRMALLVSICKRNVTGTSSNCLSILCFRIVAFSCASTYRQRWQSAMASSHPGGLRTRCAPGSMLPQLRSLETQLKHMKHSPTSTANPVAIAAASGQAPAPATMQCTYNTGHTKPPDQRDRVGWDPEASSTGKGHHRQRTASIAQCVHE